MAKAKQPKKISNRRASFDYELGKPLIVGIELTGAETKSLRMGHGHLRGAYVTINNNQLYLINATITGSNGIFISEDNKTRARRLLAKKSEIEALKQTKQQGSTLVPVEIITKSRYIKLKIAVGKGKKRYDKRQAMKARDDKRRSSRIID